MDEMQREALTTANEYLFNLRNGVEETVTLFEQEQYSKACNMVASIADGIEYIEKIISLTKNVLIKELDNNKLNNILNDIVKAIENEDFVLVGDLLNYEILPILQEIHNVIQESI